MPATGGIPRAYRLPGLTEITGAFRTRLPPVARVVGLDPQGEALYVTTAKQELLAYDLESSRIDTVATGTVAAALGPDGTLFSVDAKRHVVTMDRREREAWPQLLPAVPERLFGALDQRLVALVAGAKPEIVTAASDAPPATRPLSLGAAVAATREGDLLAAASDSGVVLVDPLAHREAAFVPLSDGPVALGFSPSGHRIYVARKTGPGLAVVDRFERKEMDGVALPAPAAAVRLDPVGRWLLARPSIGDSAWLVDLPVKRFVGAVPTSWQGDLPSLSPDGTLLARDSNDVIAFTPDSLKESGRAAGAGADFWLTTTWLPRGAFGGAASVAAASSPSDTGGQMYVQVSVSQNQAWANDLATQLTSAGLAAKVLPPTNPDDGYRVVLGPYASREQAEAIGKKLGKPFWIYQPGQ